MTTSTVLKTVYASAPTDEMIIQTLEIELPSGERVRLVHGYEDMSLHVNGQAQLFEACSLDLALPARDTSGNQTLKFAIGLNDGRADRLVSEALESAKPAYLVYREYLYTDTSAPASAPIRMTVLGGEFNSDGFGIEASYFDMLNTTWSRERYTSENAPGVKYL